MRPNTGRPLEMHVNLRIGSALGQRSKRFFHCLIFRNNINMRLMPIPLGSSSHLNPHGTQSQSLKEILIGTG